ncbi:hypothetical protein [Marinobacter gelidimuriae]|uniref:hypothetical protein n=1 Tax=Marinobacter gelidimuriae TaxID=2739064 RepID=UPI0003818D06|nr:hypothetical protein [Marinobacter gelidimuriae]
MSNQPLSVEPPEGLPRSQVIGLVVGLAGFLACLIIPPPGGMSVEAWAAGGMMLPIGLSIIAMTQSDNEDGLRRFGTALLVVLPRYWYASQRPAGGLSAGYPGH